MAVFGLARRALRAGQGLARKGAVMAVILGLTACSAVYRNHGYVPADDELALVEVGVDTFETVGQKIGRPSSAGLLNNEGWVYVQSRDRHFGPREAEEIERQVVPVTFHESGVVENIARFGLEDGRVVEISRRVTETNIKGISLIQQLLTNIGRIRAEDVVN